MLPHDTLHKRILRYVRYTNDRAFLYRTGLAEWLIGYTDAIWVGNAGDRKSTLGFAFSFGSSAIAWSRKKQPIVALSRTKAEYSGVVVVTCKTIWLKRPLKDLHVEVLDPTMIYYDKLNNIQLSKNPVFHA